MKSKVVMFTLLGVTLITATMLSLDAGAASNNLLYQGTLLNAAGQPVPDGNYAMSFSLFTQENGERPFSRRSN